MAAGSWRVHSCAATAVLAAALYLNSIGGEFVFDDHEAIETNADVRFNTPLSKVFSNDFWGLPLTDPESHKSYRPLVVLSFRLNRLIHGLWAPGFHLVNIVLHCVVCVLYHWMLCHLNIEWSTAAVASLLFAAHPIHTEAVSSIVGRTELLSAMFFTLSLLLYQCSLSHTSSQRRPSSHSLLLIALTICSSIASMLCKEQGVTVLAVCLVSDMALSCQLDGAGLINTIKVTRCWIVNRVGVGGIRSKRHSSDHLPQWLKLLIQRILILSLSTLVIVLCRLYINGRGKPLFVESDNPASFSYSLLTRTLTYSYLIAVNAWLLLCPSRLCFDWSMDSVSLVESERDVRNIATVCLFSALAVIFLWASGLLISTHKRKSSETPSDSSTNESTPHSKIVSTSISHDQLSSEETKHVRGLVIFSLSLVVLPFLPASNLFFPVGFVVAERVLYLPSMGLCLLTAVGWSRIKSQVSCLKPLVSLLLLLSLAAFSVKTVVRNTDWYNTESLAKSAVPVNPGNAKIFMTLGTFYTQLGQRKCELFYKEALRLRPNYTAAWTNLGLVLLNTERPAEAESCYQRALSIKPDHVNANINMGHLCRLQERWEEASRYYQQALQRRPRNIVVRYQLGVILERMEGSDNLQRAESEFSRVVELQPNHWESHAALARILATTTSGGRRIQYGFSKGKRLDLAVYHYRKALSLDPEQVDIHHSLSKVLTFQFDVRYSLSKILTFKGELKQAKLELLEVIKLAPDHSQAHYDLGAIYKQLGNKSGALKQFQKALQLEPTLKLARQEIEELTHDNQ